jgi:Iron permease FTR1 family
MVNVCSRCPADGYRHVNCCNPEDASNGGWGIFNAILGWQNSATIGSVVSYCVYWIFVSAALIVMRIDERRVSLGKASLWRAMLRKGPKTKKNATENGVGIIEEPNSSAEQISEKKSPAIEGLERDLNELTV